MDSTLDQLQPTLESFGKWLQTPGFRAPRATVLHHTWRPLATDYRGLATIEAIRRYHLEELHWEDIGASAYACPDGTVFTGRPLSAANWCHAVIRRDPPEAEAAARCKWDTARNVSWFNQYGFGLETVANYDEESTAEGLSARSLETALRVLAVVHTLFAIPPEHLFFHRDVTDDKTCPGTGLERATVREWLRERL